jgi:hypothetical protein
MRAYIQYRIEPVLIVKNAYFLRADLYELYATLAISSVVATLCHVIAIALQKKAPSKW